MSIETSMIIFISISYRMARSICMNEIRHYGVKGMKWGVRRNLINNARERGIILGKALLKDEKKSREGVP